MKASQAMSTQAVLNPYNGDKAGCYPLFCEEQVSQAIDRLTTYKKHLSQEQLSERLNDLAGKISQKKNQYAELITSESGLCIKDTLHEVERAVNVIRYSASSALRLIDFKEIEKFSIGGIEYIADIIREPVGIVACITPFNHPLNQVVHKVCPALASNNACLLKPSEKTPMTAFLFVEDSLRCGIPEEMLQIVTGDAALIGKQICSSNHISMISFTGSTRIGEILTQNSGIKKLSLELGGNDALLVMPDANLDKAVAIAAEGSFRNSGQRCSAIKRIIVHSDIYRSFCDRLVQITKRYLSGDPMNSSTDVGTVISEEAAIEILSRVQQAVEEGARVIYGGNRRGALLEPTVVIDVDPSSLLVASETFGPVASVMKFDDYDEAINIINNTIYGLNSAIVTNDKLIVQDFINRVEVGGVRINLTPGFRSENVPFGGNKSSGFGRSGVWPSILEMTNQKTIIRSDF